MTVTDEQLAELEALAARETDPLRISRAAIVAIPSLIAEVKRLRAVVADRAAVIEECAKVAEQHFRGPNYEVSTVARWIAEDIRALATQQEKDHG